MDRRMGGAGAVTPCSHALAASVLRFGGEGADAVASAAEARLSIAYHLWLLGLMFAAAAAGMCLVEIARVMLGGSDLFELAVFPSSVAILALVLLARLARACRLSFALVGIVGGGLSSGLVLGLSGLPTLTAGPLVVLAAALALDVGGTASGARAPSLPDQLRLASMVATGYPCMVMARAIRLAREGLQGYACRFRSCTAVMSDPTVVCLSCNGALLQTWPRLDRPLVAPCPKCGALHPTWRPLVRAAARGELRLRHASCTRGGGCCNDRSPPELLLIVWEDRDLPAVLLGLADSVASSARRRTSERWRERLKRSRRIAVPDGGITVAWPPDSPVVSLSVQRPLAGQPATSAFDGVIVIPPRPSATADGIGLAPEDCAVMLRLPSPPGKTIEEKALALAVRRLLGPSGSSLRLDDRNVPCGIWAPGWSTVPWPHGLPALRDANDLHEFVRHVL